MHAITDKLATVFALFLTTFVHVESQSPCLNPTDTMDIQVDDTTQIDAIIHQLNFTANLDCTHLYLDSNNSLRLNISLRNPCEAITVFVAVTKLDLFPPEFAFPLYKSNISENAAIGTEVFRFKNSTTATDRDCGTHSYNYDLEQTDGPFRFVLGSLGNVLLTQNINYEEQQVYRLNVSVINNQKKGYTELEIDVLDIDNRDPVFTSPEYQLNVTEESITEEWLNTYPPVLGYDGDKGINQTIYYSFADGTNSSEYFYINETDGTILQMKAFDREKIPSLKVTIRCYQSDKPTSRTADASVIITVLDINDNLPIFNPVSYNVSLIENAYGYVSKVTAMDQDQGINGEFSYHLSATGSAFSIDASSGIITVKDPTLLDRETTPELSIEVFAVDSFGNVSQNNATVFITLIDTNDNSPQFADDSYTFFFNETLPGSIVARMNATDADSEDSGNADIRYSIQSFGDTGNAPVLPLAIDEISGEINVTGPVLPSHNYDMIVQACDNPTDYSSRRCTYCRVLAVYIANTTTIFEQSLSVNVFENVPIDTMIQVLPVTGDEYSISTDEFIVDRTSHVLKTATLLDRENTSTYDMNVLVTSHTNGVVGNLTIDLQVLDVNDNAPTFSQEEYYFVLPETSASSNNKTLGYLQSEDLDENENSNRSYFFYGIRVKQVINKPDPEVIKKIMLNSAEHEILNAHKYKSIKKFSIFRLSYPGVFNLDPVIGAISLLDEFWQSTQTMFSMTAMVTDHGTPSLSSVVPVYVSYMKTENTLVRISAPVSQELIIQSKDKFQQSMANTLGYESVNIQQAIDVTSDIRSVRSYIFFSAMNKNSTNIPISSLQREVAQHWYALQDLFRQPVTSGPDVADDMIETAEIALIAVAAVVFLGAAISIFVVCKQWNIHIKHHQLYQHMSRRNTIYDSQELKVNFGDENFPSRHSTFRSSRSRPNPGALETLETSFGGNYINPVFTDDEGHPVRVSSWTGDGTPRIPRWSTSDSLKDAIASLEDLTNRLNSEDNISRVSNMSKARQSQKSFKEDTDDNANDKYIIPPVDYPRYAQTEDSAVLVRSDILDHLNSQAPETEIQDNAKFADGEILREIIEINAPNSEERQFPVNVTEASTAF